MVKHLRNSASDGWDIDATTNGESIETFAKDLDDDCRPDLYFLEESKDKSEFRLRLARLIVQADRLSIKGRRELAKIAYRGWKPKRGRPQNTQQIRDVFFGYCLDADIGRAKAIRKIVVNYKMTEEAAAKLYDQASETNGQGYPPGRRR